MSVRNDIFDKLIDSLAVIKDSGAYEVRLRDIKRYAINYLQQYAEMTPLLMVVDVGDQETLVQDATHTRYAFHIEISGYVSSPNWPDAQEQMYAIGAAVKKWVQAGPSLGDNVLAVQMVAGEDLRIAGTENRGLSVQTVRIIYWCINGTY